MKDRRKKPLRPAWSVQNPGCRSLLLCCVDGREKAASKSTPPPPSPSPLRHRPELELRLLPTTRVFLRGTCVPETRACARSRTLVIAAGLTLVCFHSARRRGVTRETPKDTQRRKILPPPLVLSVSSSCPRESQRNTALQPTTGRRCGSRGSATAVLASAREPGREQQNHAGPSDVLVKDRVDYLIGEKTKPCQNYPPALPPIDGKQAEPNLNAASALVDASASRCACAQLAAVVLLHSSRLRRICRSSAHVSFSLFTQDAPSQKSIARRTADRTTSLLENSHPGTQKHRRHGLSVI